MVYYKATRLNGTDFRTGDVHFWVGESIPVKPERYSYECCTDQVFHAADTPSETLIGCSWPCRLFEVEGTPVAQEDHKFGFRTFHVVREIESWKALGPNGLAVSEMIEQCKGATSQQAIRLEAERRIAKGVSYNAALDSAWDEVCDAGRYGACDAASQAAYHGLQVGLLDVVRDGAGSVARIAAHALIARDLISAEHFNILYDPWKSVMGDL